MRNIALHKFATEVEMRGIFSAYAYSLSSAIRKFLVSKGPDFDRKYGTVTNDWVEVADGEIPDEAFATAVRYVPSKGEVIRHICRKLPIRHEEFTFIDMGSGRGRALLLASDFPFKEIIGVEISPQHHKIAEENIAIYRSPRQQCLEIKSICENALGYEIPKTQLVLYLYQPFNGNVLQGMLKNIEQAIGDKFECYLCFTAPHHNQDVIRESGYFHLVNHVQAFASEDSWILYANAKGADAWQSQTGK